jgi:hypothetical protein
MITSIQLCKVDADKGNNSRQIVIVDWAYAINDLNVWSTCTPMFIQIIEFPRQIVDKKEGGYDTRS